jgi:ubiquinone/menaquinone biosynthesis C-methylase UbiE
MLRTVDYDTLADSYDRRYDGPGFPGIERTLRAFLGERPGRVLEVGCGTGHWLAAARQGAAEAAYAAEAAVAGIDLSWRMLARARRRLPAVALARGRAEALPWRGGAFGRVVCINAYHHFPKKLGFLVEARRLLGPGGGLLIVGLDPHAGSDRWWVYDHFAPTLALDRERYPAGQQLREALDAAGFCRIATREADHLATEVPARLALERGLLEPYRTSQLAQLTADEVRAGLDRLQAAMAAEAAAGRELVLPVDLHYYATVGWVSA